MLKKCENKCPEYEFCECIVIDLFLAAVFSKNSQHVLKMFDFLFGIYFKT